MQRFTTLIVLAALVAGGIVFTGKGPAAVAQETTGAEAQAVAFDVAENATRFIFDPDFADDGGLPLRGAAFVTEGYIYPAGTLTESNGVLEDGSPEFPDMVLGQWTCRGWFYGDAATTTTGPIVLTTQIYSLGAEPGTLTFVSEGYELVDVGVAFGRAITGGTGPLNSAGGQVQQTLLGLNATQGVNLHFEAELTFVEAGVDINSLLAPIPMVSTPVAEGAATPTG